MSCKNCMAKMGVTGILDSLRALFSGGTPQNQPEIADAASPQIIPAGGSGASAGSPAESTDLPFSLTESPLPPAAEGGIVGEGTTLEGAPASTSGATFGTASSPGGRMLRLLQYATSRPGEPGGPTYGNRPQPILRANRGTASQARAIPVPSEIDSSPAAVASAKSNPVTVHVPAGQEASGAIASHTWGAPDPARELTPWENGEKHAAKTQPLPTLSTHPGAPLANATAHRPAAASTPHRVSSATKPATPAPAPRAPVVSKPLTNYRRPLGYRLK